MQNVKAVQTVFAEFGIVISGGEVGGVRGGKLLFETQPGMSGLNG